jgi:hypothetical protein
MRRQTLKVQSKGERKKKKEKKKKRRKLEKIILYE